MEFVIKKKEEKGAKKEWENSVEEHNNLSVAVLFADCRSKEVVRRSKD